MLGLGLSLTTGGVATPAYVVLAKAFVSRVEADGGTVESFACLKTDMAYLTSNPAAPAGYTVEWSAATVGSSAEFRINLVGGAGYAYTYAVTDSQATEVTGSGVMSGNIQAVVADLSTLVDGQVTLAVYLTGAGGNGNVVTDTANLVGYTGLLDTYSGAAAAYSLRLLDTSYTGSAVRVRRASDNAEQDIAFANNELDTATLETFASGTDAFVTTWYDQSGNGNDATQTSASNQPQIVSSGTAYILNSKPAIAGTGAGQLLLSTELNISTDLFIATTLQYAAHKMILGDRFGGSNFLYNASLAQYRARMQNFNIYFNSTALALDTQYNSNVFRVGGDVDHSRNGTLNGVISGASGKVFKINTLMNGYNSIGYSMSGYAQEVIIWGTDQSANRTGIETNINDFYSIY